MPEKVKTVPTSIRLPLDLHQQLNRHCAENTLNKSQLIIKILRTYLDITHSDDLEYQLRKKLKGEIDNDS
jgi:metal-responsive CopG/Arc/MetJ family transcriptional regulator